MKAFFLLMFFFTTEIYASQSNNVSRYEVFDFEKLDVEGTSVDPDDMINMVNNNLEFQNPDKLKSNFNEEIKIDVSSIY